MHADKLSKLIRNNIFYHQTIRKLIGIDLKQHGDNIFKLHKKFYNHPQARGFCLFITKTQVEAMEGKIVLESTVEKGSKFVIQLSKSK